MESFSTAEQRLSLASHASFVAHGMAREPNLAAVLWHKQLRMWYRSGGNRTKMSSLEFVLEEPQETAKMIRVRCFRAHRQTWQPLAAFFSCLFDCIQTKFRGVCPGTKNETDPKGTTCNQTFVKVIHVFIRTDTHTCNWKFGEKYLDHHPVGQRGITDSQIVHWQAEGNCPNRQFIPTEEVHLLKNWELSWKKSGR